MVYSPYIPVSRMARQLERNILKYARRGALQPEGVLLMAIRLEASVQYSTAVTVIKYIISKMYQNQYHEI
jgi:hypothetical protein